MARPQSAVASADVSKSAPFLYSVEPMASHLRLFTSHDDQNRAEGTVADSMIEALYPLSEDTMLRYSVSDINPWTTFRLGKFFEAVDALTADVAYKHTRGNERGLTLVTASHSHSRKVERTNIERDLALRCYVTRTGSASLELRTDALQYTDGEEKLVNTVAVEEEEEEEEKEE